MRDFDVRKLFLDLVFPPFIIAALGCFFTQVASCEDLVSAIALKDATGAVHKPLVVEKKEKATVLLFLMHDCPIANATAPSIARLVAEFERRGVKFYGVYATETAQEITTHCSDFKLPFPGLLDPQCRLARHAGVTRVPEAAVFSPSGERLYRGRIDDRATKLGSVKPNPSREDLRLALEAILAGKPVEVPITEAVGCYLEFE